MSTARAKKDDTIHIRTAPKQKDLIERAAEQLGMSVSTFIMENALRAARQELGESGVLALSPSDSELFFNALMNPPAPNARLQKAFRDYGKKYDK